MGLIIVGAIGVAALVGGAALSWIAAGVADRRGRVLPLVGAFVLTIAIALVAQVSLAVFGAGTSLIAALVIALLAAATLFFLIGRQIRWRWPRLLALIGIAPMCMLLTFSVGMAFGDRLAATRAERMAEEEGFAVLLPNWLPAMRDVEGLINVPPGDATISLTWVEKAPEPDAGVWLGYNGLDIYERKSGTGLSLAELSNRLRTDASRTRVTVMGQPALLAEYVDEEASILPNGKVRELLFDTGGVTVNMRGLSREQLIRVANSLTVYHLSLLLSPNAPGAPGHLSNAYSGTPMASSNPTFTPHGSRLYYGTLTRISPPYPGCTITWPQQELSQHLKQSDWEKP